MPAPRYGRGVSLLQIHGENISEKKTFGRVKNRHNQTEVCHVGRGGEEGRVE